MHNSATKNIKKQKHWTEMQMGCKKQFIFIKFGYQLIFSIPYKYTFPWGNNIHVGLIHSVAESI